MTNEPTARLAMVTLDCDDATRTATFWAELLGGVMTSHGDDQAMVQAGDTVLGFGRTDDYEAPRWPDDGHKQFHLDLAVTDIDAARERALSLGATLAQPQPDGADGKWVVLLDPAGHPFCLAVWG